MLFQIKTQRQKSKNFTHPKLHFLLVGMEGYSGGETDFSTVLAPSPWLTKGLTTDQLSFPDDAAVVIIGVVGHDKNTVILP
jgi:hypothetical protein